MEITVHGGDRLKDRMGLKKKSYDRIVEKALSEGLKHSEVAGGLKRYMDKLYLSHKTANNMRIYSGQVFIFRSQTLITVIDLPQKYFATVNKIKSGKLIKSLAEKSSPNASVNKNTPSIS